MVSSSKARDPAAGRIGIFSCSAQAKMRRALAYEAVCPAIELDLPGFLRTAVSRIRVALLMSAGVIQRRMAR
jgi:hypothetical protein